MGGDASLLCRGVAAQTAEIVSWGSQNLRAGIHKLTKKLSASHGKLRIRSTSIHHSLAIEGDLLGFQLRKLPCTMMTKAEEEEKEKKNTCDVFG